MAHRPSGLELALIANLVATIVIVLPLLFVMKQHVIELEVRTAPLCQHGLPKPEPVPVGPDGCAK